MVKNNSLSNDAVSRALRSYQKASFNILAALSVAVSSIPSANAQLYWNTNGVSATWTAANWNTTGTGSTYSTAWSSGTNVIFGVATGGTNNATFATTTVGDITVNGNTTITAAGTLSSKTGGSTVTVADNATLAWAGQSRSTAAGNFNWTKAGNGIWDLGASSLSSGQVPVGSTFTLNAGMVIFSGSDALGGTNATLTINGGVLAANGSRTLRNTNVVIGGNFGISNLASGILTWNGTVNVGTVARTITNLSANSILFTNSITNTGGLIFTNGTTGTGAIKLSGNNTFTGGVTLNSGRLNLNSTSALGTGTFIINGGTLDNDSGGGITNANNNAMVWGGDFSFAGTTNLNLGTGSVNLSGNRTVTVTANELAVGGALTNTGQLIKSGAGSLILSAASTYSGGTVLNAGTLGISNNTALGTGNLTINGGTLGSVGAARTITNAVMVGGDFTLGGLSGNNFTNTLNGGVDLGGQTRTITLGNSATIGGVISNGGLTLATSSSARGLTLANSNTFTGPTTINAGRLVFIGSGALSSSNALNIAATSAATNDISGITASGMTVGSLAGGANGALVLGSKNLTVGGDNTSTTYAGTASGAGGSITKTGNGTMTFSGTSTYDGATTVNGGKFVMNGTNTSSAVTVSSGGTVGGSGQLGGITLNGTVAPGNSVGTLTVGNTTFGANGAYEFEMYNWAGTAGSGWDLLNIGGTVNFENTSANPFSINLFSMSSTIARGLSTGWNPDVNWTNNFATYTSVATNSSNFDASAFTVNLGSFSNSVNGSFSVVQNGNALALLYTTAFVPSGSFDWNTGSGAWNSAMNWSNGAAPTNGNSVIFSGTGGSSTNNAVTSLKGMVFSNTASGSYVVSGNAITNGVDGIVNNSARSQTVNNDITLGIGQTFNAASGNLTIGGSVDTAGVGLTVAGSSNTVINGNVSGAGGSITKVDGGTLTLNGTNTYSGGTTVSAGRVVGNSASLQGGIVNNAAVEFSQGSDGTYGGVMSGSGRLEKSGAGSLTLTGTNTYNGGTLVSGGTLVGDTTTMRGNITNNATVVYNQAFDGTNTSLLTGSGDLIKQGGGTLVLTNNGNSANSLMISSGALHVRSSNNIGSVTVAGGASLGYGGVSNTPLGSATITLQDGAAFGQSATMGTTTNDRTILNNLVLAGNVRFGAIASSSFGSYLGGNIDLTGGTRTITFSNSTYVGGVISNGTGLVLDSGGSTSRSFTLTNGVATYSGPTTVNGGVLEFVGTGAISSSSALNLAAATTNATFNIGGISGAGVSVGSIAGSANSSINLGAKNLSVGANGDSTTYAGGLSGAGGSLTKLGNGTLTLTGTNSYNGGTLVSAGRLAGTTASLQGGITNNSQVEFSQSVAGTYSGAMIGSGSLTKSGAGDVTLSGANSYSGGTTVSAGKLIGTTTSLQGAIANAGTVEFSQSTSGTYTGAVSGAGSVVKSGSGNVTLSGANSYSGGTVVSAGTLTGDTTSLQGAISNGATVAFNQATDGTFAGTLSGTGALTKSGAGNLTLSGNNSGYSGAVTVGAGKVSVANNSALGTGAVTITDGSVVAGNGRTIANSFVLGTAALSSVYYSENFNSIGSGLPSGWTVRTNATSSGLGSTVTLTTSAQSWTSGAGGFANFAATTGLTSGTTSTVQASSADRALGVQQTSSFGDPSASFVYSFNTLGKNVSSIGFDLMLLANNTRSTTWSIEYGLGASPTSFTQLGTWSDPGAWGSTALNFTTANFGSSLDNQSDIFFRISALSGSTNTGTRDPMAIDNFVINTAAAASGNGTLGIEEAGSATYSGAITVNNGATLTAANGGESTFSGSLSGAGGITKTGAGNVILTGANTYSGGTLVSAGQLRGNSTSLQGAITNNGTVVFNQTANGSYTNLMSGTGSLVKEGSGSLTLDKANTYSGGTSLNGGAILLGANSALGTGAVTIGDGTILASITTGRTLANNLIAAGNFTLGNGTQATTFNGGLDLGGTTRTISLDNSATFNSVVSNGGLVINNINATNTRNFTLAGANTFGGGITLNSGNLRLNHTNGAGTGSITQTDGNSEIQLRVAGGRITNAMSVYKVAFVEAGELSGALTLNGSGAFDVTNGVTGINSGVLSGVGSLSKTGSGTLKLTGENTYSGGTLVSGGVLEVNTASVPGSITNNASLVFNQAANGSYASAVSGSGTLAKVGSGKLTLTGLNTYTGATSVDAGTLEVASGASIGSSATTVNSATLTVNGTAGNVTVNSGGTVKGSGTVSALSIASGGTLAVGNSPGTLTASSATWNGGGTYAWEINNFLGSAGTNYDFLNITGGLTISANSGSKFIIDVISLLASNNTAGEASNFNAWSNYSFAIATAAGGISGFDASYFDIQSGKFVNSMLPFGAAGPGSWYITQSGNSINLNYAAAIPEPCTGSLLLVGLLGVLAARPKRSKS